MNLSGIFINQFIVQNKKMLPIYYLCLSNLPYKDVFVNKYENKMIINDVL